MCGLKQSTATASSCETSGAEQTIRLVGKNAYGITVVREVPLSATKLYRVRHNNHEQHRTSPLAPLTSHLFFFQWAMAG